MLNAVNGSSSLAVELDVRHEDTRYHLQDALKGLGVSVAPQAPQQCLAVVRDHEGDRSVAPVIRLLTPGKHRGGSALTDETGWAWLGTSQPMDSRTLQRLLDEVHRGRCLGLQERFDEDASFEHYRLHDSEDKSHLLQQLKRFADQSHTKPFIIEGLVLALDEAFSNAVYDAPTDESGHPFNRSLPRNRKAISPRPVDVTFASDSEEVGFTVRDCYGTLPKERFFQRLRECYGPGGVLCEDKDGGAGLGLFFVLENSSTLSIEVRSGEYTQITVTRKRQGRRRSFKRSSPTLVLSFD